MTPGERLNDHVARFNACVKMRHFEPFTDLFTDDGRMRLVGNDRHLATGTFTGHEEIAGACARSLADDTLHVVTVIAANDDTATFDYARGRSRKTVAGQIILKWKAGRVSQMTMTMQ